MAKRFLTDINASNNDLTNVDSLALNTATTDTPGVGKLVWDDGEGTVAIGLKGGNVNLQLGQEMVVRVYNGTGSTISSGKVVYISGAQGQRPSISLADADTEATSSKTLGITAESIANGAEGIVATFGVVTGMNTSAFTAGQALWLSSTAGDLTSTMPVSPAHAVFIGYAISINASSGRIFVNPQNGYELKEIHDVLIDGTPADNEVLAYDSSSGLWINQTPTEAGLDSIYARLNAANTFTVGQSILKNGTDLTAGSLLSVGRTDNTANRFGVNDYGITTIRTNSVYGNNSSLSISTASTTNQGLIVRGVTSQSANLFEAQDVNGSVGFAIRSDLGASLRSGTSIQFYNTGNSVWATLRFTGAVLTNNYPFHVGNAATVPGAMIDILPDGAGRVGQIIRGFSGQTADLLQIQNNAGTNLWQIYASGTAYTSGRLILGADYSSKLNVATGGTTQTGIVVRGATSQTANLQEWQNSSSSAVASLSPSGLFTAVSKSFDIPHPTKDGMRLRYGSLEGPENGVYIRGRSDSKVIELPDHWLGLVHEDSITVSLTPVGRPKRLYVKKIESNKIHVGGVRGEYFFTVFAERKDIDKLTVEY